MGWLATKERMSRAGCEGGVKQLAKGEYQSRPGRRRKRRRGRRRRRRMEAQRLSKNGEGCRSFGDCWRSKASDESKRSESGRRGRSEQGGWKEWRPLFEGIHCGRLLCAEC